MTTFALIPGAGGDAWFWHRLTPKLEERGHRAIAIELPATDETAGLAAYADTVVATVDNVAPVEPIVVVAQSMGGFVAPLVCERLRVRAIVLLNAMTPSPGETAGDWWANTGQQAAARAMAERDGRDPDAPFDPWEVFFHGADPDLVAAAKAAPPSEQSDRPFDDPWPLEQWPEVPTRFLAARDDRLFPLEFQRRVAAERLGLAIEETPGGHLSALTHPIAIADRIGETFEEASGLR